MRPLILIFMSVQLTSYLVGMAAGAVRIPRFLTNSRNPVFSTVTRLLWLAVPIAKREAIERVTPSVARWGLNITRRLHGATTSLVVRAVPATVAGATWPISDSPLSAVASLGLADRRAAYEAGRFIAKMFGYRVAHLDLVFAICRTAGRGWRVFVRSILKLALGGLFLSLLTLAVWYYRQRSMQTVYAPRAIEHVMPVVHAALAAARVDVQLDDDARDVENHPDLERSLPDLDGDAFVRRCVFWCKANGASPDADTPAQRLVVKETLARELKARDVRQAHIANVLDIAVQTAFLPNSVDMEASRLENSPAFRERRVMNEQAKTPWWSPRFSWAYGFLGRRGAVSRKA